MSEMVEKVAKALCVRNGWPLDLMLTSSRAPYFGPKGFIAANPADQMFQAWKAFEDDARTAIEIMRDYSEEMSQVGGAVTKMQFGDPMDRVGCSIAERCYLAMIDAALDVSRETVKGESHVR